MTELSLESRALALLEDVLDQPPADRDAWVLAQTEDDFVLRARMMQLLAASGREFDLLTGGAPLDNVETGAPERVGAYRIGERLGQGGMGAVYRAHRDSGDFDHVVAIKLIRPGALSEALVERFKQERQILAELAHPNIARLFDGGTTGAGEPFIVMEYVDGRPIDRWADDRALAAPARMRLILAVCDAVRFAHQNLIVHRDITPPNVLVTPDGGVKLIDFGISRPPETAGPAGVSAGPSSGQSMTPGFAAPERLSGAGATTLSDVYSLGRLIDLLLKDQGGDPDLKAIVAKATADDPDDRYASVDALMDDIERYLDGRPVAARKGGRRYAIGKFVGRYRLPVALAAGALALILVALVVTLVSLVNAREARDAEARRFDEVRTLAGYMLFSLNDDLARTPGNTAVRAAVAAKAQHYLSALAASRDASPHLRLETARGLAQLAKIQGVPPEPNLGDRDLALGNLKTADDMLKRLRDEGMPLAELAPDIGRTAIYRGLIQALGNGDIGAGAASLKAAERVLSAVPVAQRSNDWHLTWGLLRRAQAELQFLNADDAALARTAQTMSAEVDSWPASLRSSRAAAEQRAMALFYRASSQAALTGGDFGIPAMQQAKTALLDVDRRWPNDPATLYALTYLDYIMFAQAAQADQNTLSSTAIADAQARANRLLQLEENDQALKSLSVNIDQAYAQDLANRELYPQAIATQRGALAKINARLTPERRPATLADLGWGEMMLGVIGRKAGDRALACESWTKALAYFEEVRGKQALTGFHEGFLPGLKSNLALCKAGRPLSAFGPLR